MLFHNNFACLITDLIDVTETLGCHKTLCETQQKASLNHAAPNHNLENRPIRESMAMLLTSAKNS